MCAIEARRGCGYRKQGGIYLVGSGGGSPCDRLPVPLTVCPTCSAGFHQSRGWTWIHLQGLVDGVHQKCEDDFPCALCMDPAGMGKVGLLWIGEAFYKTARHFMAEAKMLGISRRIHAVPRNFVAGQTWVLLAHPRHLTCAACGGAGRIADHETLDYAKCTPCEGKGATPAVFYAWKPEAVEKILPESQRDSKEAQDLLKRGIRPVYVPDSDKDHAAPVYDDEESEE